MADAERAPLIAQRGNPFRDLEVVVGYNLNDPHNYYSCTFFDHTTNRCTTWSTHPDVYQLFDCDDQDNQARLRPTERTNDND